MIPALLVQRSFRRRQRRTVVWNKAQYFAVFLVLTVWLGLFRSVWQLSSSSGDRRRVLRRHDVAVPDEITAVEVWQNKYDVVHVLNTRFMQHQSNLLHLGRARFDLFRTITLPSLRNQTTGEFLWVIRIDPDLHDELKGEFLHLMDDFPGNIVVVLSNTNVEGFRQHGLDDITNENCLLGRTHSDRRNGYHLVRRYHEAAQTRLVLETRLDADDALSFDLMEWLQREAYAHLHQDGPSSSLVKYRVWCLGTTIEWQFYNPLDADSALGSLVVLPYGHCVTPGITFGYQIGATADDPPTHKHHKLHTSIPKCRHEGSHNTNNCLSILRKTDSSPLALRARTPTSAGMMNLYLSANNGVIDKRTLHQFKQWNHFQRRAWTEVQRLFGIEASLVQRLRRALKIDLALIAADNALGQCTPGHSCKASSQKLLLELQGRTLNPTHAADNGRE